MTKSNHSKMLPIVAATIRRRIEGCFGSADACTVPAVMLHSLTWFSQHPTLLRCEPSFPPISGGCRQFRRFTDLSKDKLPEPWLSVATPRLCASLRTTDFHSALVIAGERPIGSLGNTSPAVAVADTSG